MALAASLKLIINAVLSGATDLGSQSAPMNQAFPISFSDGAGAGQANVIFADRRVLAASANEDLDLVGSLTNLLGGAAAFARVKAIIIVAAAANVNNVVVSRPAAAGVPFVDAEEKLFPDVRPGGLAAWVDPGATGVAVTATTADLVNIANSSSGSSVTYDIIVIGAAT
jgi:hypothetical protein